MDPRIQKVFSLPTYLRVAILVAILVVVGAIFYFGMYQSMLEEQKRLRSTHTRLAASLKEKQEIANNLPKFKAEYEQMEAQLNQSLRELPKKKEIPNLLTTIANLARKQGLEVRLFQPQPEVPIGFYAEVPVKIQLFGDYHSIAQFYESVSKLDRIVNVGDINIKRKEVGEGEALLDVDCRATTFRFLETPYVPNQKGAKNKPGRRG